MSIEKGCPDDHSGGFDLEHTPLNDGQRLERLLLALAVATLWGHALGERVVQAEVDAGGKQREPSLFQLGPRFLKRCLVMVVERLPRLQLILTNLALLPLGPRTAQEKCQ
ncbi:MAG: hypothetical protein RML36_08185 [Anaerolineae bacterium]|nr:hypothetical protein [Anaerolineae bacterium]